MTGLGAQSDHSGTVRAILCAHFRVTLIAGGGWIPPHPGRGVNLMSRAVIEL
jgi:hypothetical protein